MLTFTNLSKINLKAYDVISWLNKNLINHFIWYLEKEKRYDIANLSTDVALEKEHLYEKTMQKIPQKLIPDPFLILVNNPKQPLHARNSFTNRIFWKRIIKKFKKVNFTFLSNRMSSACHSHVPVCDAYVTRIYSYVIRMSLVCTRMSSICHLHVPVCHSYVLACHPYVTRMYSYVIRMSLVRTRISSVVTRMWFYHGPQIIGQLTMIVVELFTTCIRNLFTDHLHLQKLNSKI